MAIERLEQIADPQDRNLVTLLQELVRIPSWVPENEDDKKKQNENAVVDYLEHWLRKNTNMESQRQSLDYGRYNLISAKGEPEMIFLAHTDTVNPSEGAPYDQLAAEIHEGKVWGLGSADMKSGIASMIQALSLASDFQNTWIFLYADEEYKFLGMKALIKEYGHLRPRLIVSSDGSDLKFGHGCRGLIEFRGRFTGETGHPARGTGNSAIRYGFESLLDLEHFTGKYRHPVMGGTSFNIAHVMGGAKKAESLDEKGHLTKVGQEGNVVPDIMDFVVDIRPGSPDLSPKNATEYLKEVSASKKLGFEVIDQTHGLGAWYTDISQLKEFIDIARSVTGADVKFENPGASGYLDLQMLWDATERPPAFMFGGGNGNTAHKPKEHISIENLIKTRDFFKKVLEKHANK